MPTAYTLEPHAELVRRNTLRVRATARWLATVHDAAALPAALADPEISAGPVMVLGEGSNLLLAADYPGTMLVLAAATVAFEPATGGTTRVVADAGASWDALVTRTLAMGCAGFENLALIPGLVGAAPIQNIGAYGVEVGEYIEAIEAYDRESRSLRVLARAECAFSYRESRFKREVDRWIVTRVRFRLPSHAELRLDYPGVRAELEAMAVAAPSASDVAQAVRRLRRRKLPDPADIGNAGSFFKNPIVPASLAAAVSRDAPGLPVFPGPTDTERKLSAAWLIEACGWRGRRDGDAGISDRHALVLVNHGAASGGELLDLARRVADSVELRYGIRLEPEPRIVGAEFRPQARSTGVRHEST
jgi:UDP-N-acetylmuramate dehydrogenase